MNEYQKKYLVEMTNTVCRIMNKEKLSEQDIQFIVFYRNELKRSEFKPFLDRTIDYFKRIKQILIPEEDAKSEVTTNGDTL